MAGLATGVRLAGCFERLYLDVGKDSFRGPEDGSGCAHTTLIHRKLGAGPWLVRRQRRMPAASSPYDV